MFYVTRNAQGAVCSLSEIADEHHQEAIAADHPDVRAFLTRNQASADTMSAFGESDMSFIRVLDDVIDLLVEKDLLRFTELPAPAQKKLLERRSMRESLSTLSTSSTLLDPHEDDDVLI